MGFAMALTGSCPGTTMVQLGAGLSGAKFTAVGGLVGTCACGYFQGKGSFDTVIMLTSHNRLDESSQPRILVCSTQCTVDRSSFEKILFENDSHVSHNFDAFNFSH